MASASATPAAPAQQQGTATPTLDVDAGAGAILHDLRDLAHRIVARRDSIANVGPVEPGEHEAIFRYPELCHDIRARILGIHGIPSHRRSIETSAHACIGWWQRMPQACDDMDIQIALPADCRVGPVIREAMGNKANESR